MKTKHRLNINFHSQTNEQIKKMNQTLEYYLYCFCNFKQNNWISILFITQLVYNYAKQTSTNISSFEILFDYNSNFMFQFDEINFDVSTIKQRISTLQIKSKISIRNLKKTIESQINQTNKKFKFKTFNIENNVILSIKNLKQTR